MKIKLIQYSTEAFSFLVGIILTYVEGIVVEDYIENVETIYQFKNYSKQFNYLNNIFDKFTKWLITNGYKISTPSSLYEVFTEEKKYKHTF